MEKGTQQIICNIRYFEYFLRKGRREGKRGSERGRKREEEKEEERVSEPENVGMRRKACWM